MPLLAYGLVRTPSHGTDKPVIGWQFSPPEQRRNHHDHQPLVAYSVINDGDKDFWLRLGRALQNKNGGYTVLRDAMPTTQKGHHRIVLQPPKSGNHPTRRGRRKPPFSLTGPGQRLKLAASSISNVWTKIKFSKRPSRRKPG
jgi:hypothetical protein